MRTPSVPAAAESGITILVLALLLSIQPVTTDLYLPALPALTRSLGAPMAAAQLTLSGRRVDARWDLELAPAMAHRGLALHEEATLPALLRGL